MDNRPRREIYPEESDIQTEFGTPEQIEAHSSRPENEIFSVVNEVLRSEKEFDDLSKKISELTAGVPFKDRPALSGYNDLEAEYLKKLGELQKVNTDFSALLQKVNYATRQETLKLLGRD